MAQFDLFANSEPEQFPLVVDVQADVLHRLATRIAVPLMALERYGGRPITRLNPIVKFKGVDYVILFQDLVSVSTSMFGSRVGTLQSKRAEIIAALDLLFTGI